MPQIILLALLLVGPGLALYRLATEAVAIAVATAVVLLSSVTFVAYASDKRRASGGQHRVPEVTLHLLAFLGGWPGAFVAQRVVRHKTAKFSFQAVFWLTVATHQFAVWYAALHGTHLPSRF